MADSGDAVTSGLAWLNELMVWLGRWVPRLVLIEPTHRGVRFGPKGGVAQVGPGLVAYWPITHSLTLVPITTQSFQTCTQTLPLEGAEIVPRVALISAALQFRVTDAVLATTSVLHLYALVDNRTQAALAATRTKDASQWQVAALAATTSALAPYGVVVETLDFVNTGTGVAIKNMADWQYGDSPKGERNGG